MVVSHSGVRVVVVACIGVVVGSVIVFIVVAVVAAGDTGVVDVAANVAAVGI